MCVPSGLQLGVGPKFSGLCILLVSMGRCELDAIDLESTGRLNTHTLISEQLHIVIQNTTNDM